MKDFNKEDLDFYLPDTFKGLSKEYLMDCIFDEEIQNNWKPTVGDIMVGCTGNIWAISAYHKGHEKVGGDKFFFGGGLCNRDGGHFLDETYVNVMNADGMEYAFGDEGFEKQNNPYYSKFTDFRYVPYPHEKNTKKSNL